MNRVSAAILIILVTIAAVEFGLLGASAAGFTGRGGEGLPPVRDRLGVPRTATATALPPEWTRTPTATPVVGPSPPQLSPPSVVSGITIIPAPLAIQCDGSQTSHVRVRILDVNGNPAPDGVNVYFEAYNGNTEPYFAQTVDGYAETDVRFYDDIFPYGPNLLVHADQVQAGIRILCFPQSDECPLSPPAVSPPCGPTPTPTPCFDSPPSSPPCIPPTPVSPTDECAISPPSVSPPCEPTSTPPPSTPVSPPALLYDLALDCSLARNGIQNWCEQEAGSNLDVGVVFTNRSGRSQRVGAFRFAVGSFMFRDRFRLVVLPALDDILDGNPDFNEEAIGSKDWSCASSPASVPNDASYSPILSCVDETSSGHLLASGASILLGVVHFAIPENGSGKVIHLPIANAAVFDNRQTELGSCNPVGGSPLDCLSTALDIGQVSSPPVLDASATAAATSVQTATPARTATAAARTATAVATRTPPPHRCADVSGNGRVTLYDVQLIAKAVSRGRYRASYDINRDGRLTHADVLAAAKQFGRRC